VLRDAKPLRFADRRRHGAASFRKPLGVAAGGTVLALAAIPPVLAAGAPVGALDPVFSLIEAHRAARAAYLVALDDWRPRGSGIG
jgi:hypothetical protein